MSISTEHFGSGFQAPLCLSRLRQIPYRYLGGVAVENTLVTSCFVKCSWTQHNDTSSYSHYHNVTCIRASDAFELTVFKRLKGFKWYRKRSSGPLALNFLLLCVGHKLRQRLTGSSAVTGHYSNWSHEYYNPRVSLQFWERTATQLSRTITFVSLMGTQHPLKASKCFSAREILYSL